MTHRTPFNRTPLEWSALGHIAVAALIVGGGLVLSATCAAAEASTAAAGAASIPDLIQSRDTNPVLPVDGTYLVDEDVSFVVAHEGGETLLRFAGDEIVEPGAARPGAATYDANRYLLTGMLERLGASVTDLGIIRDESAVLAKGIGDAAKTHDLVLTSGGVSTGEADHVKEAVESVGTLVFWRMAIKPGRPVAMGVIQGTPFIGLPGNPVASFVTFAYVVRPTILALSGARQEMFVALPVRANFTYKKKKGRREYVRASLMVLEDGTRVAQKFPREGAGLLSSLCETDGLVELADDCEGVKPGDAVAFIAYPSLF